jgi:hypothetical protein
VAQKIIQVNQHFLQDIRNISMKNLIVAILGFTSASVFGQNAKVEFDGSKWNPPYSLDIPTAWNIERFSIPIEFATEIPYQGVEDIRFTPGWGDSESNEYWTYSFLWYLDGKPETNAEIISKNLQLYYTGLIGRNIEKRKIPADKIFTPKASFKKIKASEGDLKTFQGTIYMLDYMEQKPITLNCVVHLKACEAMENKTFIFYEISPKPLTDDIWQQLNSVNTSFNCSK